MLQGHDKISPTFAHGDHEGQSVADLIEKLMSGDVRPSDLTTVVAARFEGRLYAVYGNRRIYALKEYSRLCEVLGHEPGRIPVIVHPGSSTA